MLRHIAPAARPPQGEPAHAASSTNDKARVGDAFPTLELAATFGQLVTVPDPAGDYVHLQLPDRCGHRLDGIEGLLAVVAALFGLGSWAFHDMYQFPFGPQLVVVPGPDGTVELEPDPGAMIGGPVRVAPGGPGQAVRSGPSGGTGTRIP